MKGDIKILFVQRVAAQYRAAFFCSLAKTLQVKILRGPSKGIGDVVDAQLPSSINYTSNVNYFMGERMWLHIGILDIIRNYQPDVVVVSPTLRDLTNLALFSLRKKFNYKIVGWGMGEMPGRSRVASKIHQYLQKLVTDKLDAMIVYSSEARHYYRNKLRFEKQIEIAPNAVDLSLFTNVKKSFENKGLFTLVYVGRIIKEKKIEELIDFVLSRNDIGLKIVGSGDPDYIDILKSKIGKYCDRIDFIGPLYEAALNEFLIKCDLFVLPSRGGLAINHAMASGLPVLVSVGDGTEKDLIIENETGFIFEDGDFAMMATCIDKLKTNPALLQKVAGKAVRHVRSNFDIQNMCSVFNAVVSDLK